MEETCPDHPDVETVPPGPAKYSPEDRHGEYRRRLKLLDRREREEPDDASDGG